MSGSEQADARTVEVLARFAAAAGQPVTPEHLARGAPFLWVAVDGLAAIPDADLREIPPTVVYHAGE